MIESSVGDINLRDIIIQYNEKVIHALGIDESVIHNEIFLTETGEPIICEIAARPGGHMLCDMVRLMHGVDLRAESFGLQLGHSFSKTTLTEPKCHLASLLAYGQSEHLGIIQEIKVKENPNGHLFCQRVKNGEKSHMLIMSGDYLFALVASGETPNLAMENVQKAYGDSQVRLAP